MALPSYQRDLPERLTPLHRIAARALGPSNRGVERTSVHAAKCFNYLSRKRVAQQHENRSGQVPAAPGRWPAPNVLCDPFSEATPGCARTSSDSAKPPARSDSCFSDSMPRDLLVRKLGRLLLTRGPGHFFEGSANLLPSEKRDSTTAPLRID